MRTCDRPDCLNPHYGKGLCRVHYLVDYKLNGPRCSIEGCDRPRKSNGLCNTHNERARKHGDPLVAVVSSTAFKPGRKSETPTGEANAVWKGDDVGRHAAHDRVRGRRGRPSEHGCSECGKQAQDWAYTHDCPREKVDAKSGHPYSPDPDRYQPMCRSCHKKFDLKVAAMT